MAWTDYGYEAGPVGDLETLMDFCDAIRIKDGWSTGRRGSNPVVQYQHGEKSSPDKYTRASNFTLETTVSLTNSSGATTHADGSAGHFEENFGDLKRIFGGKQGQLVRLQRSTPDQGTTYIDVEMLDDARPTQNRFTYGWALHAPYPFWTSTTANTGNTPPTLTVAGSAPITKMVITLTGGTDTILTHTASGKSLKIEGVMPAGGVEIDTGAGTCLKVTGGTDYSNYLIPSRGSWMELDPGANAVTVGGGGSASVDWYDEWR